MSGNFRSGRARRLAVLVGGGMLALACGGLADEREARLEQVRARLQSLQAELNTTKTQRDSAHEQVNALERKMAALMNDARATERRLHTEERRLTTLRQQTAQARRQLERQRQDLSNQMRMQYIAGRQEQLKLVLSQRDPEVAARMLTYYRYLQGARRQRIAALQTALVQQQTVEQRVQTKQAELRSLRADQDQRKSELESSRTQRSELLATLDRRVASQTRELEALREDESRLTRLLREIVDAYADMPLPGDVKGAFGTLKGKLALPAKGQLLARFGEPRAIGNLRWRGVFLAAAEGAAVRAVSRGRVVYADWLRGFGLLLILDHGDGYMTLYGHNQSLSKLLGESVEVGDTIARVGNTGDAPQSGLYFEIRHNGEPRDPLIWCRAR